VSKIKLQIQSVLYKTDKKAILRSLESSIAAAKYTGIDLTLAYGDASPKPLFTPDEISEVKLAYQNDANISYEYFNGNTGHGKGQNLLARNLKDGYLMFLNPDVVMVPDAFTELFKPFENKSNDVGITEAKQTPFEHPKEYNKITGETSWASGGCMLIPVNVFHNVGGFDESFFLQCDDVDISWRVRLSGKKIIYCPSAIVFHDKRLSASHAQWMPSNAESRYTAEALLLMCCKWSRPWRLWLALTLYKIRGTENHKKALRSYRLMKAKGKLPIPINSCSSVSDFKKLNYGKMRFTV